MKVTISIPTVSFERLPMLTKTIKSIRTNTHENTHIVIVVDARFKLYKAIKNLFTSPDVSILLNEKHSYWVISTNRVCREFDSDYYIYGTDDVLFPPDCIKCALSIMKLHYPDGFGLVNLFRRSKATFGLMGRKWVEHFPDRQPLCPDFVQYGADREITEVAAELGVYDANSLARWNQVKHFAKIKNETWRLTNGIAHKDPLIRNERERRGYKWGIDFNLIRK